MKVHADAPLGPKGRETTVLRVLAQGWSLARAAQDPGTDVGGTVPSHLALSLEGPSGFASFPAGAGVHELAIRARVTSTEPRPLDAATDPLLATWRRPIANQRATVRLRQRIEPGERPRGSYRKTLLITVSPDVP